MSNYAYVEGVSIVDRRDTLPRSWRNVSGLYLLQNDEAALNNLGWYTIQKTPVVFDPNVYFVASHTYDFSNSIVTETAVLEAYPIPIDPVAEWRRSLRVTPYQAKVVLYNSGLLSSVETMMAEPSVDQYALLAWESAIEFKRLDANIIAMGAALGLTEIQLDDMFVTGATIGID